ncbi:MAG: LysR family transcriptional regulator [Verrucomicrobiae bacterium]|nr:LysR family transcriptional regulator [Verrucomicrobiae bacterium]
MNEYLATAPFDLYELHLFHLVAETGSFTRAGQRAGLTQSAITRQIRGMEDRLGVTLFERTTRQVSLTLAGRALHERSGPILAATDDALNHLRQKFNLVPKTLHVGVARTIGLAYLPGFFFAFQRKFPEVQLQVSQQTSDEIIEAVAAQDLDVGLLCRPPRLPRGLQITHCFKDDFTFIAPPKFALSEKSNRTPVKELKHILAGQRWLMIQRESNTGRHLRLWLEEQDWEIEPAMELDSFDAIVNLVSLGLGVSIVPHRVLPLYDQRRAVKRIRSASRFSRELVVVVRKNRQQPAHLSGFVENILF